VGVVAVAAALYLLTRQSSKQVDVVQCIEEVAQTIDGSEFPTLRCIIDSKASPDE